MKRYTGFPVEVGRVSLTKEDSEEILRYFDNPKSMADIQCQTSIEYGKGRYSVVFKEARKHSFEIDIDDNQCPFNNHCFGDRSLQVT